MSNSDSPSARRPAHSRGSRVGLRALDQREVAIHLVVQGRERLIRGKCSFGLDARLGAILRILCPETRGNLEILIRETDWNGEIKPGEALGCDYAIRLCLPNSSED